jgi:tight adherence protein B
MNFSGRLAELGDPREVVARVSAFLFVFLLWSALVWSWWLRSASRARRVSARLGLPDPDAGPARELRLWSQGQELTTLVQDPNGDLGLRKRLERWRQQARVATPLATLILGAIGITAGAFFVTYVLTESLLAGAGAVVVAAIFLKTYANKQAQRGVSLFETQFVDALDLAARSLRAGHPLTGAFQLAGEEIPAPVGTIFKEVCQQQDLGLALDESLRRAAQLRPSPDLKLFATSVIIQLESGGNLADMMDRLAAVIRDRLRLSRHARILTAQTQLSKRILLALPFVLFLVNSFLNPGYMEPLYTTPEGRYLIAFGAVSLLLGAWVMNRMVVLRY